MDDVNKTTCQQQQFCPKSFYLEENVVDVLDSSGCPEVHADGRLGDLQVGQTAEVLRDRETALSAAHTHR